MTHRHLVTIHRAGAAMSDLIRCEVGDDLMTVKIEVDPFRRRTSLRTAQESAVESAGLGQIVDRKREMEQWLGHDRGGLHRKIKARILRALR